MKPHSHLYTIIQRVKRVIRVNKNDNPLAKLHAVLPHAFNLAEYLSYEKDYTPDEEREARRILKMLGLPIKVDEKHGIGYHEVANKLFAEGKLPKIPGRHCRRCGRELSNKISVEYGLGPICRSKQAHEDQMATAGIEREEILDGIEVLSKELKGVDSDTNIDNPGQDEPKMEVKTEHGLKQKTLF